jgi:hypothetical protein
MDGRRNAQRRVTLRISASSVARVQSTPRDPRRRRGASAQREFLDLLGHARHAVTLLMWDCCNESLSLRLSSVAMSGSPGWSCGVRSGGLKLSSARFSPTPSAGCGSTRELLLSQPSRVLSASASWRRFATHWPAGSARRGAGFSSRPKSRPAIASCWRRCWRRPPSTSGCRFHAPMSASPAAAIGIPAPALGHSAC